MLEPRWIRIGAVLSLHDRALAEHGGLEGIRDQGLLESALQAPINAWAYAEPDISALAAIYAVRIAKNHAFNDGNKRTAAIITQLFLRINGHALAASDEDYYRAIMDIANSEMTEEQFADWLRKQIR